MSVDQIEGWASLLEWFGFSPNFHDAEIIGLDLRRDPEASVFRVHAWRTSAELDPNGHYRRDRHAIVVFELAGITELQLDGWNHQNVLFEMRIASIEGGYEMNLATSYGMEGRIVAKAVNVTVQPIEV